jgi:hypothetical protein
VCTSRQHSRELIGRAALGSPETLISARELPAMFEPCVASMRQIDASIIGVIVASVQHVGHRTDGLWRGPGARQLPADVR